MTRSLFRPASLILLLSSLAVAPLALAHPSLVRSTPAADASVAPASQIELQFSEKVMPRATRIELSMDHGRMKMAMPTTAQDISEDGHTLRARFAKPLDEDMIRRLAREHQVLVTVEEGAIGGFASHVLHFLSRDGLLDHGLRVRTLTLPDLYLDHAKPEAMYARSGLDRAGIVQTVFGAFGRDYLAAPARA